MVDNDRSGLLSRLIPDEIEKSLGLGKSGQTDKDSLLITFLKEVIGPSSGPLGDALGEFLDGKGTLVETTRAALTRGPKTAEREVGDFLSNTFNLKAATARTVAQILIRLFPAIGKLAGGTSTDKPKPRRKKKPTSSSSARPKKPKSTSSSKPKKPRNSTSAKPVSASKPKKRKTTPAKPAAKKTTRNETLD